MFNKVTIFGCCGSGKTTFARAVSEITNLPLISLDLLNWHGSWNRVSNKEFDTRLKEELEKDFWIIEGLYARSLDLRIDYCDTLIYIDIPSYQCLANVLKRTVYNWGTSRDGMPSGCHEKIDLKFWHCTWNYDRVARPNYLKMLSCVKNKNVIILSSYEECNRFLYNLRAQYM